MPLVSRNERGSLLIVSLWGLCLLSIFVLVLARSAKVEALVNDRVLAEGALDRAGRGLAGAFQSLAPRERGNAPTGLTSPWVNVSTDLTDAKAEGFWTHLNRSGEETALSGWSEEESRININLANEEELTRLFWGRKELAAAVMDWRDNDNERRKGGAERGDLSDKEAVFRNGPFRFPEELLLVPGMPPELFDAIRQDVTLFGDGRVNWNTVLPRPLEVLGVPRLDALALVFDRVGPDGHPGTADDRLSVDATDALHTLDKKNLLTPTGRLRLQSLIHAGRFSFQGQFFRWTGMIDVGPGTLRRRVSLVVAPWIAPGKILQWSETTG